ncbi:uncharacterized protein MYCFIDRAFT_180459 [Pseudocercospora fijiensis CIRAD86]|uniref:Uncharacterized protein n=1 Tax=Pseudocercospora fijiensis (strain CIRAD86) TaxID=383855 RepID=M2ZCY2_PSEFD|nr:uncharacterized protein MYCFIDRAFT_180459 [Pseudocercospora fijiensis CIRAD86]EME76974.1 hypothetical protein MYCFIDRAFT_180459 [Pseudocercospora fijiensis CIRAD86]
MPYSYRTGPDLPLESDPRKLWMASLRYRVYLGSVRTFCFGKRSSDSKDPHDSFDHSSEPYTTYWKSTLIMPICSPFPSSSITSREHRTSSTGELNSGERVNDQSTYNGEDYREEKRILLAAPRAPRRGRHLLVHYADAAYLARKKRKHKLEAPPGGLLPFTLSPFHHEHHDNKRVTRTAPHHTTLHRTAPHRTAPHRTASETSTACHVTPIRPSQSTTACLTTSWTASPRLQAKRRTYAAAANSRERRKSTQLRLGPSEDQEDSGEADVNMADCPNPCAERARPELVKAEPGVWNGVLGTQMQPHLQPLRKQELHVASSWPGLPTAPSSDKQRAVDDVKRMRFCAIEESSSSIPQAIEACMSLCPPIPDSRSQVLEDQHEASILPGHRKTLSPIGLRFKSMSIPTEPIS